MAVAHGEMPDLSGRWSATNPAVTIDVVRCGSGWCGIEVVDSATCGRTALRLDAIAGRQAWTGKLELKPGAQPYVVRAALIDSNGRASLDLQGHTGDGFEIWRRTYPFEALLARQGDAVCVAPKVS